MYKILHLFLFLLIFLKSYGQINDNRNITASSTAALEIIDTSKGILIPKMTLIQRNRINNPTLGLMVYVLNDSSFYAYRNGWKKLMMEDDAWKINGNSNATAKYIGTSDNSELNIATNNTKQIIISPQGKINIGHTSVNYPGYTQLGRISIDCEEISASDLIHGFANNDSTYFQSYSFARASGNLNNPQLVKPNMALGGITASGYNGTEYLSSNLILFALDGTPTSNAMPGKIEFYTTETGNGTIYGDLYKRMIIKSNGNVGIGENEPKRTLHIKDVMRLEPRLDAPANPSKGDIYFDDTLSKLMVYDGTDWKSCW